MIITKEVKVKKTENISSEYIEFHLKQMGLNVLRWAIVKVDEEFYTLTLAVLEG